MGSLSTPSHSPWKVVPTDDGTPTLHHSELGQSCHAAAGAWREANERYAQACGVSRRASGGRTVRLLDIGTGLGLNLAAAWGQAEEVGGALDAVTLESDPSVLEAADALGRSGALPEAVGEIHGALRAALAGGEPHARPLDRAADFGAGSRLRLLLGDAQQTLRTLERGPLFDVVFLDPFSLQVAPALWEVGFLAEVAARMAPGSLLATYSTSLTVRARLTFVGLNVGFASAVGGKAGTLASPDLALEPMLPRAARRIARRVRALAELSQEDRGVGTGG